MGEFVLEQTPDGSWYATATSGRRLTNIAGWRQIADLLDEHDLAWRSVADADRFRAQFGPPPPELHEQPRQAHGRG